MSNMISRGGPVERKAYIITGPTSGIGRATAMELARYGAVVLVGRIKARNEKPGFGSAQSASNDLDTLVYHFFAFRCLPVPSSMTDAFGERLSSVVIMTVADAAVVLVGVNTTETSQLLPGSMTLHGFVTRKEGGDSGLTDSIVTATPFFLVPSF